jgi:hypothetical protein
MDQQSYITQLKRQPRIGSGGSGGSGVGDEIKATSDAAGAAASVVTGNLNEALKALQSESTITSIGIGKLTEFNRKLKSTFESAAKATMELETRNKLLNTTFGIGSIAAAELSQALINTGEALNVPQKQMIKYAAAIHSLAPTINTVDAATNKYYIGLSRVQQVLTTNLGLSEDQAASYSQFAMQTGESAESSLAQTKAVANSIEKATGMQGAFKQITEGVAKATADVQLQYGRIPGGLQMGVLKAKALGLEMANLAAAGKNLLNIEASIGNELEYQLLSGNRLVGNQQASAELQGKSLTNAYREATIKGDANSQANTLNTILEQEGKTLKNNLFAREQMSKLLGIDEASLSRALQKKSILEKLPGGEALFDKTGEELEAAARAMAGTNKDQQKLVDELVKNDDQRTTDEKIEEVLEMMVDTGIKAQLVNQKGIVKENQETLIQTAKNQKPVNSNQVKPDQAAIAGALKVAYGKVIGMNDGVISPDGGLMVSGEKGSIQLDKDDSIVTGTNLGGSSGKSDNGLLSAIQLLVAATQEQTNHLKQLKSDPLFTSNLNAGKYS